MMVGRLLVRESEDMGNTRGNPPTRHERPTVAEIVLGTYHPGGDVEIFHPEVTWQDSALVEVHESEHLHLCHATTFGWFQRTLGKVIGFGGTPATIRSTYRNALGETIRNSWLTHEGAATALELVIASIRGKDQYDRFSAQLTASYRDAAAPFMLALSLVKPPFIAASAFLNAIAHVALSTPILSDMLEHDAFLTTNWQTYFSVPSACPDSRLQTLFQVLANPSMHGTLSQEIARALGFHDMASLPHDFHARWMKLDLKTQVRCTDAVSDRTVSILGKNAPFPVAALQKIVNRFNRSWGESAKSFLGRDSVTVSKSKMLRDPDEKMKLYLNIDHKVRIDLGKGLVVCEFTSDPGFWQRLQARTGVLYAYFAYNWTRDEMPLGRSSVEPGGGVLFMHKCVGPPEDKSYVCPVEHDRADFRTSACRVAVARNEVASLFERLRSVGCVLAIDENPYLVLARSSVGKVALQGFPSPLCIVPPSSTYEQWEATVAGIDSTDGVLLLVDDDARANAHRSPFCILTVPGGDRVWARPTSQVSAEWLRKLRTRHGRQVVTVSSGDFPADWNRRLDVFLCHYLRFGF